MIIESFIKLYILEEYLVSVYQRLNQLNITLPKVDYSRFIFEPGVQADNLLFISGQCPEIDGKMQYTGRLGEEIDIDTGKKAARLAALNCLAEIEHVLGSLDRVEKFIRVMGYIRSANGFGEQPFVLNGASELLIEIFGDKGKHARAALGVSELPFGAPVEIEMIVQVKKE